MIDHILVPLDLHELSEAKIPLAIAQAQAFDAELILLHVTALPRGEKNLVSPVEAQARTYLDALTARLHSENVKARSLVRFGAPAVTILEVIDLEQVDLVVLGTTIRQGLTRRLLGSVAEEVIAKASCPVLLVRPPDSATAHTPVVRNFAEDARRAGPLAPRALGIRTVDVARIVGSVGRAEELDANFRSRTRSRNDEQRYQRVLDLMKQDTSLPPISLYKLGYGYYVLDGNHRVAAAKQLGQLEIDAEVTEFMPLGDEQAQRVAAERRVFERATGLRRIGAKVPGVYRRLEEMIRAYATSHEISDIQQAALRWETDVYRPIATKIRSRRLHQSFPGERTADIFVRIVDDQEQLLAASAGEADWDAAFKRVQQSARAAARRPT